MTLSNLGVQIRLRDPVDGDSLVLGEREKRSYALIVTIGLNKERQNPLWEPTQQAVDGVDAESNIAHEVRPLRFGAPLFLEALLFADFFLKALADSRGFFSDFLSNFLSDAADRCSEREVASPHSVSPE